MTTITALYYRNDPLPTTLHDKMFGVIHNDDKNIPVMTFTTRMP